MDRRTRRTLLISLTAFVWAAAGAASVGRFKLAAHPSVTINLKVQPPIVRVSIDGERQFDGDYVDTTAPVKLYLGPGRHKVRIGRDGYMAQLVTIDGHAGQTFDMVSVVLEQIRSVTFVPVEIAANAGEPPVHVDLDDGFAGDDAPVTFTDVLPGQPHVVTFFPKWPDRDVHIRCRFTPPPPEGAEVAPYRIKVRSKGSGKLKLSGCERLKETGHRGH